MWLKILRQNISHLARRAKGSASIEQKNGNGNNKGNKTNNNGAEVNRNEEQNGSPDKSQAKKKPTVPGGGPLLQQTEISTSQLDFFRMLDEKIENGPDYDESADARLRAEHVSGLLRRWELASISCGNVANLNNSNSPIPKHQQQQQQHQQPQQQQQQQQVNRRPIQGLQPPPSSLPGSNLSAKDREGMRNIVGGRPESAPVYVQRISSANRVDGLQVGQHYYPSPNMPRHVLESISQSPTQSVRVSLPPSLFVPTPGPPPPPPSGRYQHYEHSVESSPINPYVQQFQITASPTPQHHGRQPRRGNICAELT